MSPLRQQMDNDMVLRGMAVRTRESYLAAVFELAKYYHRSPDELDEAEVQRYLLHLIQERQLAWSSCNLAVHGLRFFYRITLKRRDTEFAIPRAHAPQKLPEILSREEVARLLVAARNLKHRVLLMTTYAAGLRVSEVAALKVSDIDSGRMMLRVEQGKGAKDRYTLLSPKLLGELRRYWAAYRPKTWLFPKTRTPEHPMNPEQAQKMYYAAKSRAGIAKHGGIHSLRHAFATHLLEAGADVHTIQRLMGHRSISTTTRYFHLARSGLTATTSPLELLDLPACA